MAVIQKIRNKFGKIAGGVIGLALVSFIVSDALNGSLGRLFGGHSSEVITVNGTKVEVKEYEKRVKEYELLTTIYSNRGPLDDEARAQIREQVLQSITYEAVASDMCDKLGIEISDAEKKDLIYGANAHPMVRQFTFMGNPVFANPDTKQFDPARVKGIEDAIAKEPAKQDPNGTFTDNWNAVKGYILRNARIDKFNALMSAGSYAPLYQAKRSVIDNSQMAAIRYVKVPFSIIPDDQAKVSDDDIKAYMQNHKALFETDQASRSIEYVSFDIVPSSQDTFRATGALEEMRAEFTSTKDEKNFVSNKTDEIGLYTEAYLSAKTFGSRYADTIMKEAVGSVYGPYLEDGSYRLTKILDKKTMPDSVTFKQIVVFVTDGKTTVTPDSLAKIRIDSINAAVAAGVPFDSLYSKYNAQNFAQNPKGEIPVTLMAMPSVEQQLSKDAATFIYEANIGDRKVIKIDNSKTTGYIAYHLFTVTQRAAIAPTVKVATVAKNLVSSDSTVNAIYARANEFASKSTTAADFDANVKKMGVDKRVGENIKESSFTIQGLGAAREMIKWAYNHKVGEVSKDPFHLGDVRYVVAKLVSVNEKGMMPITATNRPMLEQRIRDEKKTALIAAKFKGATLESISAASGTAVGQADTVTMGASFIPSLGYEPKVVGYTFNKSFQTNTISPAIKGQGGVFFISVVNRTAMVADPAQQQMMAMQARQQEEGQLRGYMGQMVQQMLIKKADIKYNMENF